MSALAHYFETAGLPTTLVALIREHAEAIRPPRALWTLFELGRPLGAPEDADFQKDVIRTALALLERPSGPILEDYPVPAPEDQPSIDEDEGWACPVSFAAPKSDAPETFASRLTDEVGQLRPWHETWKRRKGRTGVGVLGVEIDDVAAFVGALADGASPAAPGPDQPLGDAFKLAINDLMTFYQESANAQPGKAGGGQAVSDWFWTGTVAGDALQAIRAQVKAGTGPGADKRFAFVADRLTLPHIATVHATG